VAGGFTGARDPASITFLGKMQTYFQLVLHFQCYAPLANVDHPSGINSTKPWPLTLGIAQGTEGKASTTLQPAGSVGA
jgi:hypothetical protein